MKYIPKKINAFDKFGGPVENVLALKQFWFKTSLT